MSNWNQSKQNMIFGEIIETDDNSFFTNKIKSWKKLKGCFLLETFETFYDNLKIQKPDTLAIRYWSNG